jgi:hypothetical protein
MFSASRAPILCQDYLQIDRNELPLESRHLGVQLRVSKMIFEPVVHSVKNVPLSCVTITTISKDRL